MRKRFFTGMALSLFAFSNLSAQKTDSLLSEATLPNVISYALKNQPDVQQSLIDEEITRLQIKSYHDAQA